MPVVACPECGKKLNVPESAAGKKVRCPGCQKVFPVPGAPAANPTSAPTPPPRPAAVATPTPAPRPALPRDDSPTPMPPRFRKPAKPEPEPDEDDREADKPARDAIAGLRCPKCDSEAVRALPPNQFSRRPGYVCGECETLMRRAGTKGNFVAAMMLGVFIILLGIGMAVAVFAAEKFQAKLLGGAGALAVLGAAVAGWAFKQSRLPEPVGAKAPPSRIGFWILVFVIGLLILGGIVFGLMYVMHEML
jgi:hypothetical protein